MHDGVDARRDLDGNRMTGFALNLRSFVHGRWHTVARYDCDHGRWHMHLGGHVRWLEDERPPRDRTAQYKISLQAIRDRWRAWRADVEAAL